MRNKILVISGPTASGKSGLALRLGEIRDVCIINADSLQIYQGLPILSAQPSKEELSQVEHVLYSHLKPSDNSSVGLWLDLVKTEIDRCFGEEKLPVIVGGTGMYISKLIEGISKIPDVDETIKTKARKLFDEIGAEDFKKELINLGEDESRIENLDKQRLIRSYEVLKQTEKTLNWWHQQEKEKLFNDDQFIHINLNPNREKLYENCNLRFQQMLDNGTIEEVTNLLPHINESDPITKTLGFDEIKKLINLEVTKEQAIELASQKTRNYAKRQITWFRHQLQNKHVFEELDKAYAFIKNI